MSERTVGDFRPGMKARVLVDGPTSSMGVRFAHGPHRAGEIVYVTEVGKEDVLTRRAPHEPREGTWGGGQWWIDPDQLKPVEDPGDLGPGDVLTMTLDQARRVEAARMLGPQPSAKEVTELAEWLLAGAHLEDQPAAEPAATAPVDPASLTARGTVVDATVDGVRVRAILADPNDTDLRWFRTASDGSIEWATDRNLSDVVVALPAPGEER